MQDQEKSSYQRTSEQLDNALTGMSPGEEGMILQLADGTIQAYSPNVERILGLTIEQIHEWTSLNPRWQIIHEDRSPFNGEHPAMVALRTGTPCSNVVMGLYHPIGELIWLLINSQPLFRQGETAPYGVVTNFTRQQKSYLSTTNVSTNTQTLSERNQLLTSVVDNMNDAFVALDREWRIVYVNQRTAELLNKQPEEIIGKNHWEMWSESVGTILEQNYRQAMRSQTSVHFEVLYEPRQKWYEIRVYPSLQGINIYLRDISEQQAALRERKTAELSLQNALQRLNFHVENSPVAVVEWDNEFRLSRWSSEAERIFGWKAEEVIGKDLQEWQFVFIEDVEAVTDVVTQLTQGTQERNIIYNRNYTKDGSIVYCEWYNSTLLDESGNLISVFSLVLEVTERHKIEAALRESEERFRQMADASPTLIWMSDTTKLCNYFNKPRLEFSGRTMEEEIGNGWTQGVHADDLQSCINTYINAFDAREEFRMEYRLKRHDGEYRWLLDIGIPRWTPNGDFLGYIGSCIDISDAYRQAAQRKQAEVALRQSEERFRRTFECNMVPMGIWTLDGGITDANDALLNLVGYSRQELAAGMISWRDLTPREQVYRDEQAIAEIQEKGVCTPFEKEYIHRAGRHIPILIGAASFSDRQDSGVFFAIDLTERKRVEAEREKMLLRSLQYASQMQGLTEAALVINSVLSIEELLQVITERSRFIIGAHQAVTSTTTNQNWVQAISSISLSDKYAAWRDYKQPTDGTGIYSCVCETNRTIRMTQVELEAHPMWRGFGTEAEKHPPMRGWLAAPLTGRDGHNIGLIQLSDKYEGEFTAQDEAILVQLAQMASVAIENTRLYAAEQLARTQAESANRIKDEFLAVLSHELRTPLNPILGWAKLLRTRKFNETKTAEALETIERNAKLQVQLIDDLLDVSRILRGKLTLNADKVNLASTILAALETVRLAAEAKSISMVTTFAENIGQITGDAGRLQQVFWNLLSNAVKFTPSGGRVEVMLETGKEESLPVSKYAKITVKDTGKGIDPEFVPFVFEYFRQADSATTRKFGGLGLGLAIARQIVELHGGIITAESLGEEQGATFTVMLPLLETADKNESGNNQLEQVNSPILQGIKILVVDDEVDSRDFISFVLQQEKAEVIAVSSAQEALETLAQSKPDILLSDIGMPSMDGYMLIREVRNRSNEEGGKIPAIALTAYAGESDQQQAMDAGFQIHLPKPAEPAELIAAICQLINIRS